MRKLALMPSQAGYSVGFGNEVLDVQLSGGPSRTRADFVGAVAMVNVNWTLPLDATRYLLAFFRTATKNASEPFLIDIILDEPLPTEYTAKFVPGTFQKLGVSGLTTSYGAQLEVRPNPVNEVSDEAIMDAFEIYGDDVGLALDALAYLVNVIAPESIPG